MKDDLPTILNKYASDEITIRSISEIIANNDSLVRIPYGKDVLKKCYQKNSKEELPVKGQNQKEGVN
jgi:hypothetical protein